MLARCTRSLASRLLPGRFALVTPCELAPTDGVATDISGLLLLQHYLRGKEVDEREGRKDEPIGPEIRNPESFGEGADADRLEPGRWKHQADKPSLASEGGHGHQQPEKFTVGMTERTVVAKTAATWVWVKVETSCPKPQVE